jgi:hypothetical protein
VYTLVLRITTHNCTRVGCHGCIALTQTRPLTFSVCLNASDPWPFEGKAFRLLKILSSNWWVPASEVEKKFILQMNTFCFRTITKTLRKTWKGYLSQDCGSCCEACTRQSSASIRWISVVTSLWDCEFIHHHAQSWEEYSEVSCIFWVTLGSWNTHSNILGRLRLPLCDKIISAVLKRMIGGPALAPPLNRVELWNV